MQYVNTGVIEVGRFRLDYAVAAVFQIRCNSM